MTLDWILFEIILFMAGGSVAILLKDRAILTRVFVAATVGMAYGQVFGLLLRSVNNG